MISTINNNSNTNSFKAKEDFGRERRIEAFSAFRRSRLIHKQANSEQSKKSSNCQENLIDNAVNNINRKSVVESKSQELRLFNLEYIYKTKLPSWVYRLKCPALDWILIKIFPLEDSGKDFFVIIIYLLLYFVSLQ
jgi:hypothetical protein